MSADTNGVFLDKLTETAQQSNTIDPAFYTKFEVKRGLRNANGSGVLVGLTEIGDVHGFVLDEGDKTPDEGRLRYRGIDVADLSYLVDYLFRGGPEPVCQPTADCNASGGTDVADLSYLVDYLFRGGPPPVACP